MVNVVNRDVGNLFHNPVKPTIIKRELYLVTTNERMKNGLPT